MKIAVTLALALAALLAIPAIRHLREQPPEPPPAVRLSFPVPPGSEAGWGDAPLDADISPDESQVVFVATRGGVPLLWRRSISDVRAEPLPGTDGAMFPAWKQTGQVVAFFAGGRLKQITLGDSAIHDLAEASAPAGATWLRDGSLLFASGRGPIRRILDGGVADATTLGPGEIAHEFPVAVAGTDAFVYVAVRDDGRRIARLSAAGQERDLTPTSGHAALVDGHLLHVRDGALLAYAWDPDAGALATRATPVGLDVGVSSSGMALFTASPRLLVYAASAPRAYEAAWLDPSGTRLETIADPGEHWQVRLSPDDRFAAVTTVDPLLRALDVMLFPAAAAGNPEKLTLALAADSDPVWSPDGTRVLFRSLQGGTPDLHVKRASGEAAASEPLMQSDLDEAATDWAGDEVLFQARRGGQFDVLMLHTGTGRYEPVAETPFNETDARWSPDRRWVAYVSDESGRPDVYAQRRNGTRIRVSFGGGTKPRWTRDGALVFIRGAQVMRADPAPTVSGRFAPARVLFEAPGIRDLDTAHRSDRIAALLPAGSADPPTISAVVNWRSLLGGR